MRIQLLYSIKLSLCRDASNGFKSSDFGDKTRKTRQVGKVGGKKRISLSHKETERRQLKDLRILVIE